MLAEGGDAAVLARSVTLTAEVLNEAMVCYGQNGEALRPEQGYPLRLLLPGFEGNINVKWLGRLKLRESAYRFRQGDSFMKAMKVPKEIEPFLDVAEAVEEETLVFTEKKRPVAALVSLRKVGRESLALSTSLQFLNIIETARKEVRSRKAISLEALENKYGVRASNKGMERMRRTRRSS